MSPPSLEARPHSARPPPSPTDPSPNRTLKHASCLPLAPYRVDRGSFRLPLATWRAARARTRHHPAVGATLGASGTGQFLCGLTCIAAPGCACIRICESSAPGEAGSRRALPIRYGSRWLPSTVVTSNRSRLVWRGPLFSRGRGRPSVAVGDRRCIRACLVRVVRPRARGPGVSQVTPRSKPCFYLALTAHSDAFRYMLLRSGRFRRVMSPSRREARPRRVRPTG